MGGETPKSSNGPTESCSMGASVMSIAGRMAHERQRTSGMNPDERAWRRQWLRDQVLSPREPLYNYKENPMMMNPIRHAYRAPLDYFFYKGCAPFIGTYPAKVLRFYIGRALLGCWGITLSYYYFCYNVSDWTTPSGWRVQWTREPVYPGDEGYPYTYTKKYKREYKDDGFHESVLGRNFKNDVPLDDKAESPPTLPFSGFLLDKAKTKK